MPFYMGAVHAEVAGPIELIGPSEVILRGGMGGTYVRTTGAAGDASLTLTSESGQKIIINFSIEI